MKPLDQETLQCFLELAGERLEGEWVVIGGMVLPLLGVAHRVTVDIDVAGPDDASSDQMLTLMQIAEELGFPVEAINQAGAYFLHRIEGWNDHLVEVHRGTSATILVPDPTLFVLLKLSRLTESDLADCRMMLGLARKNETPVDRARLRAVAERALKDVDSADRMERLQALLAELEE